MVTFYSLAEKSSWCPQVVNYRRRAASAVQAWLWGPVPGGIVGWGCWIPATFLALLTVLFPLAGQAAAMTVVGRRCCSWWSRDPDSKV